jgi:hypothetical protein
MFECCHIFKLYISYLYVILSLVWRPDTKMYLVFFAFTYKPMSLLASNTDLFFFFLYAIYVFSQQINILSIK